MTSIGDRESIYLHIYYYGNFASSYLFIKAVWVFKWIIRFDGSIWLIFLSFWLVIDSLITNQKPGKINWLDPSKRIIYLKHDLRMKCRFWIVTVYAYNQQIVIILFMSIISTKTEIWLNVPMSLSLINYMYTV